jgi:L-threonylcarbamoyladenylate synthase
VEKAISLLNGKGVVAFPTDTLYGLGADAGCVEAVKRVFEIKGRPGDMALPLLLGGPGDVDRVAVDVPELAWTLVERFWPGPLTLVLKRSPEVPGLVTAGKNSVAVRMPGHQVALALVQGLGRPITGTSANPSGGPDPVTAEDVTKWLGNKVDHVVDGGPAAMGIPSTIVDLTGDTPRLVRQGAIDFPSLQAICAGSLEWC